MTRERGKPLAEARTEIPYGGSFIEWFAEEAKHLYGDVIPQTVASRRIWVLKQPMGVCAAITPRHFPNAMITRKCAPSLAVGCTMVLKPASATPFFALASAVLAERDRLPKGVFNGLTGPASVIGEELCARKLVRKLSFTGSTATGTVLLKTTATGKLLLKKCADTVKRVAMELGGHAPFVVFDDADREAAVRGAILCEFRNAGQTCVCTNRIYVQAKIFETFAEKLAAGVRKLPLGPGTEPGVVIGALIDEAAVRKVEDHVRDAVEQGATIPVGGQRHRLGGYVFELTVLANCTAG